MRTDQWSDIERDTRFNRQLFFVLVFGIICFAGGLLVTHYWPVEDNCQEDMACWNCETMGNKECGTMVD